MAKKEDGYLKALQEKERQIAVLKVQLGEAQKELTEYRARENAIAQVLITSQMEAERILLQAKDEARRTVESEKQKNVALSSQLSGMIADMRRAEGAILDGAKDKVRQADDANRAYLLRIKALNEVLEKIAMSAREAAQGMADLAGEAEFTDVGRATDAFQQAAHTLKEQLQALTRS